MRREEDLRSPHEILAEAEEILGPAVRVEWHRNPPWAIFWCPFHDDISRQGKRGRPNFGVSLKGGYWKCLRCGASGPSLRVLRERLGKGWTPPPIPIERRSQSAQRPPLSLLAEAVAIARANFRGSPMERYLSEERRIRPSIASMYGIGYGVPYPSVPAEVLKVAQAYHLATKRGWWIWAGGIVYAEPPLEPKTIQIRFPTKDKDKKYRTRGNIVRPGGAWRVSHTTEVIIVVEGLIDMLALAQELHDRGLGNTVVPVYMMGTGAERAYEWLRKQKRRLFLVPDADEQGKGWLANLKRHGVKGEVFWPPWGLDPDKAVLEKGWWPFPF